MPPTPPPARAAEVLIDQLVIHGVRHLFCVPGENYIAALDALHDGPIAATMCRQQGGASIDGGGRRKATSRPGICSSRPRRAPRVGPRPTGTRCLPFGFRISSPRGKADDWTGY